MSFAHEYADEATRRMTHSGQRDAVAHEIAAHLRRQLP